MDFSEDELAYRNQAMVPRLAKRRKAPSAPRLPANEIGAVVPSPIVPFTSLTGMGDDTSVRRRGWQRYGGNRTATEIPESGIASA